MSRLRTTVAAVALSAVTGTTVAAVSVLTYVRFQHPQAFADASVRTTHPELLDAYNRKWGLFGTGLADAVPLRVKRLLDVPDMAERFERHKKAREAQIRQTIDELRPQ
ncbi:unnamed protein product [Hyaloperonospora brassicae]|uniref:RxLR effector candidate protein n=1 Tax=Hyaloperonospora brassicae TaxID=162125 RepID=A0AAV0UAH2_HYABA|nr:unnamed protein product [Hyaloperonospora brassicae]